MSKNLMSITDILIASARNVKIILLTPIITCLITIIFVQFVASPVFTATSKIMSSSGGNSVSQAAGLAAQFGFNLPNTQNETKWVYPEIIQSRTLARAVLKKKFDTFHLGPNKTLLEILTHGISTSGYDMEKIEIIGVESLLNIIEVTEDLKTGILTLNVNASEPMLAAQINEALIKELDSHQRKYNKTKTSNTKKFIEERINSTKNELISAEEKLRVFMDRNRRIENSPALQLEQQRLGREVTVLTGVFTTLKQQYETTKIEEVKESDYVVVIDPPESPLKRSKPRKKFMVIMSGLIGLATGFLLAFVREYAKDGDKKEIDKIIEAKSLFVKNIYELLRVKSAK